MERACMGCSRISVVSDVSVCDAQCVQKTLDQCSLDAAGLHIRGTSTVLYLCDSEHHTAVDDTSAVLKSLKKHTPFYIYPKCLLF